MKGKGKVVCLPKDFDVMVEQARAREDRYQNPTEEDKIRRQREQEKRAVKKQAELLRTTKEKIALWREGKPVRLPYGLPVMLRLDGTDTVETSQGARIPLEDAERLHRLVRLTMERGEDWTGKALAGGYLVESITKEGTLTAGCHTITFDEIARFAGERGW